MAIRAGQILFDANGFIVDRIQTGGVTNLNIPTERVHEVGNFQTVAIVRDTPDLTFELESLDVSTEIEALLLGIDPTTVTSGQCLDFLNSQPINVISPFKSDQNKFDAIRGVAIPVLTLENLTYRFGLKSNATETFTLRGDGIYYIPGTPYLDVKTGGSSSYTFDHGPALVYREQGVVIYALGVCWIDLTTGTYKRLFHNIDYTDTATGITLAAGVTIPSTAKVYITYGSATTATYDQTVNASSSVKPGAVRSKDIDVYLGVGTGATPAMIRVRGVQSVEVTRRVNLQQDEEFGNTHYISQDYDTADVNGTLAIRATDVSSLIQAVQDFTGVSHSEVAGPFTSPPIAMEIRINDPDTGVTLKTIYVPDATFTAPPLQGRVQQKLDTTFRWESEGGLLQVFRGIRP